MGVLACDRQGCDNIMCDITIFDQYLCHECADEFESRAGNKEMALTEIEEAFKAFMETEKPRYFGSRRTTVREFIKENTREPW